MFQYVKINKTNSIENDCNKKAKKKKKKKKKKWKKEKKKENFRREEDSNPRPTDYNISTLTAAPIAMSK